MNKNLENERNIGFSLGVKHQIFNNEIRKRREQLGFSQKEFARIVGITPTLLRSFELFNNFPIVGGTKCWDSYILQGANKLADFLKVNLNILFPKWLEVFKPRRTTAITEHIITESMIESPGVARLISGDEYLCDSIDKKILKNELTRQIQTLTPREEKVINLRFGLDIQRPLTLEEVAREFGVSRERIRQIEAKALRKLKHHSRIKELKGMINSGY